MSDPPWDAKLAYLGSNDHAHAIGRFALAYNWLEMELYTFFRHYFPDDPRVRDHLFSSLHNRERVDVIKLCAARETADEDRQAIHYAMKCFDLCAENRNLLLHASPLIEDEDGKLIMGKGSTNKPGSITPYAFSVTELRGAALAVYATYDYFDALNLYLVSRDPAHREVGEPPPALPERPPLPRKLSLSRHRLDHEA